MNNDMKLYYDYTISPLGKLFYKTVWSQLETIKDKKILDFGSGFAFTTNFLAKNNQVTALEMDESMIENCEKTQKFTQIHGNLSALEKFSDESFDVIICHLVLEFTENPKLILDELSRLLKKNGILSIVRHNRNGRIIQSIVQDYDLDDANNLLNNGFSFSSAFGDIKYYENDDLLNLTNNNYTVDSLYGIRVLASLHNIQIQNSENWLSKMFETEQKLVSNPDFIKIAYFNHIILRKK